MSKTTTIDSIVGKTIKSVEGDRVNSDRLEFEFEDGCFCGFYEGGGQCDNTRIEDIIGEVDNLIGAPLLMAEEVVSRDKSIEDAPDKYDAGSFTWTFYKFATVNGYVTVRWYGTTNGYYSERVDFYFRGVNGEEEHGL